MTMRDETRVGIVGTSSDRGFASAARIPALRGLPPDFAITTVCTTRQESADATARHLGIPPPFPTRSPGAAHSISSALLS